MTSLQNVYERQRAADNARWTVSETYERIYWDLDPRQRGKVDVHDHPDYKAAKAEADRLTAEVAALRAEVGGRVFRVVDSKLAELATRIEKLNKKAAKLGTEPIALAVSGEHDQASFKEEGVERVIDYTFVTVNGETPMIAGWVFVATLDHEADEGANEGVGIRRAPIGAYTVGRIGQEAADAVEKTDLTAYRHAGPDCDHCGFNRRRKQTYVLYEVETDALRQIGSTCLKDYTGAHNPERIATWAEWVEALYGDLESEGGDGFGGGSGRIAMRQIDYLANVAAVIRENGWQPRWRDGERNFGATADVAESNYFERQAKYRIEVTEADREEAQAALDWVRDDLAERDDLDEFQHNLVTYTRSDYVPARGSGFVAYTIMARRREIEGVIKRERDEKIKANSEWFGKVGDRVKGLTFTVSFTREFEGRFGVTTLTKGYTPEGNAVLWFGAGGLEQGKTYTCSATIKGHETDSYNGGGKVTKVTNLRSIKEVEDDAAAVEMETTKTAAEREAERLRRIDPKDLEERLDSARASYNEASNTMTTNDLRGYEREYYSETEQRLRRLINRLEADQRAIKEMSA